MNKIICDACKKDIRSCMIGGISGKVELHIKTDYHSGGGEDVFVEDGAWCSIRCFKRWVNRQIDIPLVRGHEGAL